MGSQKPRASTLNLQIHTADLPESEAWQHTIERLHRLTLHGLGADVTSVRVDLATCPTATPLAPASDIECRVTVRLKRSAHTLNIETRHPDGALAVTQAFTRAQREAQRQLNSERRVAKRRFLPGLGD
jgi:hypothetical protein